MSKKDNKGWEYVNPKNNIMFIDIVGNNLFRENTVTGDLDKLKNNYTKSSSWADIVNMNMKTLKDSIEELEGKKDNSYKLPMSKLFVQFPDAIQAAILCSCYGHSKYPEDTDWLNFKRVSGGSEKYKDAEIRHQLGLEEDEESHLPEVFHQLWNKLAECQLWIEEKNIDIKEYSKKYLKSLADTNNLT